MSFNRDIKDSRCQCSGQCGQFHASAPGDVLPADANHSGQCQREALALPRLWCQPCEEDWARRAQAARRRPPDAAQLALFGGETPCL